MKDLENIKIERENNKDKNIKTLDNSSNEIEVANSQILVLKDGIKSRIEKIDLEHQPILYYRMAKWFKVGAGLPTNAEYTKVNMYIFIPFGLFFGLVSIALAYIGMTLRRGDRFPEDNIAMEKREHAYRKKLKKLEDQYKEQSLDLVTARQETFEAIKGIPQTLKLRASESNPSKRINYVPWIAVFLICITVCGTYLITNLIANTENVSRISTTNGQKESLDLVMDSVVIIETEDGTGSGFFIDSKWFNSNKLPCRREQK